VNRATIEAIAAGAGVGAFGLFLTWAIVKPDSWPARALERGGAVLLARIAPQRWRSW
jgi:hypothetical protein